VDNNSEYGRLYSEIVNGFSNQLLNGNNIYFKHPTIAEHFSYHSNYDLIILEGKRKGLLTEKEKIEEAIEGGWWSNDNESTIKFFKKTISNLIKTREKLLYPSQKDSITSQIKKNEAILLTYLKQRRDFVGYTLEEYVNNKFSEQLLIYFTYTDTNFKNKLFKTSEEYYNSSDYDLDKIKNLYYSYIDMFSQNKLKKIAACGFFQNLIYVSEDTNGLWGEAASKCTKFQIDLLIYGKIYKNIIKNMAENNKPIPQDIISDPDKLVEWVDNYQNDPTNKNNTKNHKSQGKNSVSSYVGATNEDLNKMGVKVEKLRGKSLLQLAEEKGGVIEKSDYLKARENS
jgi:hypothetical protein